MNTNNAKDAIGDLVERMEAVVIAKYKEMKEYVMHKLGTSSPPTEVLSNTSSPRRGERMTFSDRRPSLDHTPSPKEPQAGTSAAESRRDSTRRDTDLISTATSALKRLNFRTGKGSHQIKGHATTSQQKRGSITSEAAINTSIESANTVYTTVTVTDADQDDKTDQEVKIDQDKSNEEDKADTNLLESKTFFKDEKLPADIKPTTKEILHNFDTLYWENEELLNMARAKNKAKKQEDKSPKGTGEEDTQGFLDHKKPVTKVSIQDGDEAKEIDWLPKKGRQPTFEEDKQKRLAKMRESFRRAASWERDSDEMFSSIEEKVALVPGAVPPPPTSAVFPIIDDNKEKNGKNEKPKSNIPIIQRKLHQRTFTTYFNKRKKVDQNETREESSQTEFDKMPKRYSQNTSPKNMSGTFSPKSYSPTFGSTSTSPRLKRETPKSGKKLLDTATSPINIYPNICPLPTTIHVAMTFPKYEPNEKNNEKETEIRRYSPSKTFNNLFNSPTNPLNSPTAEMHFDPNGSNFESFNYVSPTESNIPFMCDDFEDEGREYATNYPVEANAESPMSHKRKKRYDQKSSGLNTSDEFTQFVQTRNARDAFFSSFGDLDFNSPQSRKYSILTADGSVKNFVSENSEEYKRVGDNVDKENINRNITARTSTEFPQKSRRFSVFQTATNRRYVLDSDPVDRPSKQRKVIQGTVTDDYTPTWEDVHPREFSLAMGDPQEDNSAHWCEKPDDKPRKFSSNTLASSVTTILVQQPSIQRGSVSGPSGQKDEEYYLDESNSFSYEESTDFDLNSPPHHSRSQSVKIPGRSGGRPNYLSLPQQRARVASMPNTGVEEEYYRLRHFSITCKGLVNRGDSLKSRRSKSINSVASSNSSYSAEYSTAHRVGSYPGSARNSGECSLASSRDSSTTNVPYKVILLGGPGVGKTSLILQFMTSEYLQVYDLSLDEENEEKSISVMLDEEESELTFIDNPLADMSIESVINMYQPQAYIVVYSVVDRESFEVAEQILQALWRNESIKSKAVILVGNKGDLARSRTVAYNAGIRKADAYNCKFIETSVAINHNVDELLAGVLQQIRLKLKKAAAKRSRCSFGRDISPLRWRNPRLSASLRIRGLIGRVWTREDSEELTEQEKNQLRIYEEQWFPKEEVSKRKLSDVFCCLAKRQRYSV